MSKIVRFRPTGWFPGVDRSAVVGVSAGSSLDLAAARRRIQLFGGSPGGSLDAGGMTVGETGGGETWLANLPAGLTQLWDQDFEGSINYNGGSATYVVGSSGPLWGGSWNKTALNGYSIPGKSYAAQVLYPQGSLGGGNGVGILESPSGSWKDLYTCYYLYLSPNYVIHENEEKGFYPVFGDGSSGFQIGSFYLTGGQTSAGDEFTLGMAQVLAPSTGRIYQSNGPYPTKGQLHRVEIRAKMNTSGQSDGLAQMWLDGTNILNLSNVRYTSNGAPVTYWRFDTTRGGGNSSTPVPSGGQFRQHPRITVYGKS